MGNGVGERWKGMGGERWLLMLGAMGVVLCCGVVVGRWGLGVSL